MSVSFLLKHCIRLSLNCDHVGPLQAPDEDIAKYKGFYDDGPEVLREKRLRKMAELGLVDPDKKPAPLVTTFGTKRWSELSEQERKESSKKMEVYAAMIEGEATIPRLGMHPSSC